MGKKRKKTPPPPAVETTEASATSQAEPVSITEPASSQPALSEEKAAEIVAEAAKTEAAPEPPPPAPVAVAEAAPEPEPEPAPISIEPDPEPTPASTEVAAVSEGLPETARPKKKKLVKKKKRATKPPAATREALDQKIDRLEAKLEEKKEEAAKAAREGFGSNPALDDTSVPPVDLEIHDEFFAAGERVSTATPKEGSGAYTALDPRHAQKMTAQAHARRAHLSRYVMWAVGGAAAILALGLTIRTFRGHPNEEPVRHEVAHVAAAVQQQQAAQPTAAEPSSQALPEVKIEEPKADEQATTADSAKPETSASAAPTSETPKDMPPETPKNAWQEKQSAKAALERGSNGAAIAAGERSVALDPGDAEAWLVLGAAYQAMGNVGQAKRCYRSCVSQGKRGPVSDCRDMLAGM